MNDEEWEKTKELLLEHAFREYPEKALGCRVYWCDNMEGGYDIKIVNMDGNSTDMKFYERNVFAIALEIVQMYKKDNM